MLHERHVSRVFSPTFMCLLVLAACLSQPSRPALAQGSLSKAKALRSAGKHLEAEKEVTEYLKFHPNDAEAYLVLGWCQLDRENRLGAEQSFKKALELNPNVPGAQEAKTALKLIEDSFAKPVKPPMPLKVAPGPAPKQQKASPSHAVGSGIVQPASPDAYTTPKTSSARAHTGRQLGGALTLDKNGNIVLDNGENKGPSTMLLIVVIAVAGVLVGGLVAYFVVRRGHDSDEVVI